MKLVTIIFERIPMVWLLLGLLFIATGLYLGFEYSLSFMYLFVGLFCSAYGVTLFFFQRSERPTKKSVRPLSRNFISAGATVIFPSPSAEETPQAEKPAGE